MQICTKLLLGGEKGFLTCQWGFAAYFESQLKERTGKGHSIIIVILQRMVCINGLRPQLWLQIIAKILTPQRGYKLICKGDAVFYGTASLLANMSCTLKGSIYTVIYT